MDALVAADHDDSCFTEWQVDEMIEWLLHGD